ncbi:EpsG family protein [Photorhabdus temperata]
MIVYWAIWITITLSSLYPRNKYNNRFIFSLVLVFIIGLRHQVGADWFNYIEIYDNIVESSISEDIFNYDISYFILNKIGFYTNTGIYSVNFICAIFVVASLYYLSDTLKGNKWLPYLISFPFFLIVVSMGYTRQSVAISLWIIIFCNWINHRFNFIIFLSLFILAITFHKSSIIILLFAPLIYSSTLRKRSFFFIYCILFFILIYILIVQLKFQNNPYLTGKFYSNGSTIRVALHLIPLLIYIFYRNIILKDLFLLNRVFDLITIIIFSSLFLSLRYSTLIDRFNLYFIIYDVVIYYLFVSRLKYPQRKVFLLLVIMLNTFSLYKWLNYSPWAQCCWIPYKNLMFE